MVLLLKLRDKKNKDRYCEMPFCVEFFNKRGTILCFGGDES